ncbi:MAG: hypothetical protein H7Y13_01440 [Sphingobacteriaceae bacterium]|nr:hypothetical protein [Sphingobacteriaceae bacterium]
MLKEGDDYYLIEGGYMVFTKEYHLKRGYCCKNGCKHCPWPKPINQHTETNKIEKKEL